MYNIPPFCKLTMFIRTQKVLKHTSKTRIPEFLFKNSGINEINEYLAGAGWGGAGWL